MTLTHPNFLPLRPVASPLAATKPAPIPAAPTVFAPFARESGGNGARVGFDVQAGRHLLIAGPSAVGAAIIRAVVRGSLQTNCIFYIAATQDCSDDRLLQDRLVLRGHGRGGAIKVLRAATAEMTRRQDLMLEQRKQTFRQLKSAPPPVVVILGGVLEMLQMDLQIGSTENRQRASLGGMLDAIAQYGAKTGFCLLIASQKPASALIAARLHPHLYELTETGAQLTVKPGGSAVFTPAGDAAIPVQIDNFPDETVDVVAKNRTA